MRTSKKNFLSHFINSFDSWTKSFKADFATFAVYLIPVFQETKFMSLI